MMLDSAAAAALLAVWARILDSIHTTLLREPTRRYGPFPDTFRMTGTILLWLDTYILTPGLDN